MVDLPPIIPFEPILKPAIWGGNRLQKFLQVPPTDDLIGEAWLLSDTASDPSVVSTGPLAGRNLRDLMDSCRDELIGVSKSQRFPVLLKLIDARTELSVQVHPTNELAKKLEPTSSSVGKTEAWRIIDCADDSIIYAGFSKRCSSEVFRVAIDSNTVLEYLNQSRPEPGGCYFLKAGTIHAIGKNILLFEIQQTSDITYRLYDWGRVDPVTKQPRTLHIDKGLEATDFSILRCEPIEPTLALKGQTTTARLVDCPYFTFNEIEIQEPLFIGNQGVARAIVPLQGSVEIVAGNTSIVAKNGYAYLLPAQHGMALLTPRDNAVIMDCTWK